MKEECLEFEIAHACFVEVSDSVLIKCLKPGVLGSKEARKVHVYNSLAS